MQSVKMENMNKSGDRCKQKPSYEEPGMSIYDVPTNNRSIFEVPKDKQTSGYVPKTNRSNFDKPGSDTQIYDVPKTNSSMYEVPKQYKISGLVDKANSSNFNKPSNNEPIYDVPKRRASLPGGPGTAPSPPPSLPSNAPSSPLSRRFSSYDFTSSLAGNDEDSFEMDAPQEMYKRDPYIKSENVTGLTKSTFTDYLLQKEAAMVMFYNTDTYALKIGTYFKRQFIKAAEITTRRDHGYAVVNCSREPHLCQLEEVKTFPQLKLYSRGAVVGTVTDDVTIDHIILKKLVDGCPVLEKFPQAEKSCLKKGS